MWKKTMTFPLTGSGTPMGGSHPAPYPANLTKLDGLDLMAHYRAARRGGGISSMDWRSANVWSSS